MKKRMKDFITPPPIFKENLLQALLLEEKALARKRRIRYVAGSSFAAAAVLLLLLTVAMPGPVPEQPVTVKAFTAPMGLDESGVADLYQKVEDISSQSEIRDENMGKKAVDRTILLKSGKPLQLQIEKDKLEEQAYALAY
ncbi:MAG TPA: hypothetical protein PLF44_08930 [Candidatus Mcinerneyibacteriales bacterium]|mgnify:CR=1 FL=1|jgi:phosphoribosyl-dephospho-CoA transferase|nr:hypothetical protein [Candidatus Mcinerneyibacteriota bacterium]HOO60576.1 hypothetical protein [Candidatus Mcinerneyibacteriales bacterium]HPJ70989.1 hypothetical protein [Candidatus Mcinerneyibacteriales bacterium]HPQ89963.1 hypothetical protein [Candidatus Mcinerneyibacteriales bacterium]